MAANRYARSTDGSDSDDGSTWALAKATLVGVAAIDTAGDSIYVSQSHAETTAGAISLSWAGTAAAPTKIICGNDGAEPPTASATTATVKTTGNSALTVVSAGHAYVYGIAFTAGDAANGPAMTINNAASLVHCANCDFIQGGSGGGNITISNSGPVVLENCRFKFGHTGSSLYVGAGSRFRWTGGSFISGTQAINILFLASGIAQQSTILVEGVDLSSGATAMNICNETNVQISLCIRNCKLPASWSGSVNSGTPGYGSVFDMFNCDAAGTNYRLYRKTAFGTVRDETTIVKNSGATDGTTQLAWKMVSNGAPIYPHQALHTPEMVFWNATTGSAKTVTVDFTHDSLTNLKDSDIWLEVQYLGSSAAPVATLISNRTSDVLAAGANQAASSATWADSSFTNANRQKMSVTFTPQLKGYYHAIVRLAKISYTVYVDPLLQIS